MLLTEGHGQEDSKATGQNVPKGSLQTLKIAYLSFGVPTGYRGQFYAVHGQTFKILLNLLYCMLENL